MNAEKEGDCSGSSSDSNSEPECDTTPDNAINNLVNKAKTNIIPEYSAKLYQIQYDKFTQWRNRMNIVVTDERILLAYFQLLSETYKATSLWSTYTKVKSMLIFKEGIDISKYNGLQSLLKGKSKKHQVKRSKVFTNNEISTFLLSAPDEIFLLQKVVLIFGLHGCLRKKEIVNTKISDVTKHGSIFHVSIPDTKTGVSKSFYTSDEMYPIIDKYMHLRPEGMSKFFLQYRNQKCTQQNVGTGKLGQIPKDIAKFLNLPDVNKYTGHAFRRTSATTIADEGVDLMTLKRHGVWKSGTVAEGYVNESVKNKINLTKLVSSAINLNEKKISALANTNKSTITRKPLTERNSNVISLPVHAYHQSNLSSSKPATVTSEVLSNKNFNDLHANYQACSSSKPATVTSEDCYNRNINKMGLRTQSYDDTTSSTGNSKLRRKISDTGLDTHELYDTTLSTSKIMKMTQIQSDDFDNITQEELQEVVTTEFCFEKEGVNVEIQQRSSQFLEAMDNVTQEELQEVVETEFLPFQLNQIQSHQREKQSQKEFHGINQNTWKK